MNQREYESNGHFDPRSSFPQTTIQSKVLEPTKDQAQDKQQQEEPKDSAATVFPIFALHSLLT
jgi:hypothetical protein